MTALEKALSHFGVIGKQTGTKTGPLIEQIIFEPAAGTKIRQIMMHLDDIAREMRVSSLRVSSIADSAALGFEIPAEILSTVSFSDILASEAFAEAKGELPISLGVDIAGVPQFADLAKMPHLLVAGTTGSGKSVGLNAMVLSLIARKTPQELKLVMIDPKRIEFAAYNNQKYMLYPVARDTEDALTALENLAAEMERRYGLFEENLVRNIKEYNKSADEALPYIVCVIDEFADLTAANKEISQLVQRLAQKARAAGIHLIIATQRPSVDVVTGVVKANFPTRLAYKVASGADSRTVLDMSGAEDLIGRGDALFLAANGELTRVHGAYVSDGEIDAMLKPFRAKVPAMPKVEHGGGRDSKITKNAKEKQEKGAFHCVFEFWCSLKKSERKTLLNGFVSLVKTVVKHFMKGKK